MKEKSKFKQQTRKYNRKKNSIKEDINSKLETEKKNIWISKNIDIILDSLEKIKKIKNKKEKEKELYYIRDAIKSINIMVKLCNKLNEETKEKINSLNYIIKKHKIYLS